MWPEQGCDNGDEEKWPVLEHAWRENPLAGLSYNFGFSLGVMGKEKQLNWRKLEKEQLWKGKLKILFWP